MATTGAAVLPPRSAAVARGYSFASAWEQVTSCTLANLLTLGCRRMWPQLFIRERARALIGRVGRYWLQNAPLTEQQLAAIGALALTAAEHPLPCHVVSPLLFT